MLADQAIISGIRLGGLRESDSIQMIYDQFGYVLQRITNLKQEDFDADIIRETVECFVNGVKNNLIVSREEELIAEYLKNISQKIKNPELPATPEIEKLFEDKIVWDYYLNILNETDKTKGQLLTRSFGQELLIDDLAATLVAKGEYNSIDVVKEEKYSSLEKVLSKL